MRLSGPSFPDAKRIYCAEIEVFYCAEIEVFDFIGAEPG
jgi:hypothetical protein